MSVSIFDMVKYNPLKNIHKLKSANDDELIQSLFKWVCNVQFKAILVVTSAVINLKHR